MELSQLEVFLSVAREGRFPAPRKNSTAPSRR